MRAPVAEVTLVDRLSALPNLADMPRTELEWLVAHGQVERHQAGDVVAPKGEPIEKLWVILSGCVAVRVDRGAGQRLVIRWRAGEVSGMLPYSRMTAPPGANYAEEATEILAIHRDRFPEMIERCPTLTAYTVHLMLDRARSFNTSDMQDEKMISLGKLSAGLAHELNNPASAIVRGAKHLSQVLGESDAASRALAAAGVGDEVLATIDRMRSAGAVGAPLTPLELADREHEISEWLERHGCDHSCAASLAETGVPIDDLDALAQRASGAGLDAVLRWTAAGLSAHALARDIEQAGTRIHELVGAVKRFTYMDKRTDTGLVDVEPGLRDTLRVLEAKARSKGATVTLDLESGLPPVRAPGAELNQVWMSLLENALDAITESGRIEVIGRRELDRVVIRVSDDGCGIPPDIVPQIFDPFFTTKAPGEGTGLGLEIARRLVRLCDGDISVESRPGGTEFRVSLVVGEPVSSVDR
jgi:signal transduction histidine kinase